MLIVKTISLSLLSAILFSCAAQQAKPVPVKQISLPHLKPFVTQKKVEAPDHPLWVDDPRLVNYIAATGSATVQKWGGEQAQYLSAMENARTNLTAEFKKHQAALIALQNKKPSSDTELSSQINDLLLYNAIIKEEWRDPKTDRLYLWLVLPNF